MQTTLKGLNYSHNKGLNWKGFEMSASHYMIFDGFDNQAVLATTEIFASEETAQEWAAQHSIYGVCCPNVHFHSLKELITTYSNLKDSIASDIPNEIITNLISIWNTFPEFYNKHGMSPIVLMKKSYLEVYSLFEIPDPIEEPFILEV